MLEEVAFRDALSNRASLFSTFQVQAIYLLPWQFPIFQGVLHPLRFTHTFSSAHRITHYSLKVYLASDMVKKKKATINRDKDNDISHSLLFLTLLYYYPPKKNSVAFT